MTRYYVAEESGYARPKPRAADSGTALAATAPHDGVTIYDSRGCRALATLAPRFADHLDIQGTGKLRDGRVVNVSGPCRCGHSPCYRTVGGEARWGLNAVGKPLQPFRTVAVDPDVVPLGSILYVLELDGLTMPGSPPWGGFVHDGCVLATDVGGGIDGNQLDFFVARYQFKKAIDARKKMKFVTVYRGASRCQKSGGQVARKAGI